MPGLRAIYGSVIIAGIFAFLVAPFFARLIRLFPPIVTGTVITIIGIVLLSVAALDAGGGGASQFTDPPTFGALRNLALASKGWRGLTMTPKALRRLQDLRRQLLALDPLEEVVHQPVACAA